MRKRNTLIVFIILILIVFLLATSKSKAQPSDPSGDPDKPTSTLSPSIANMKRVKSTRSDKRIQRLLATNEKYIVRDRETRRFERQQLPRPKEWRAWSIGLFVFTSIMVYTVEEKRK